MLVFRFSVCRFPTSLNAGNLHTRLQVSYIYTIYQSITYIEYYIPYYIKKAFQLLKRENFLVFNFATKKNSTYFYRNE